MPIHHIFETKESETSFLDASSESTNFSTPSSFKDRFFSSLTARILFGLLLIADIFWFVYAALMVTVMGVITLITIKKFSFSYNLFNKNWIALKRSGICGISLMIALFSPALGIMIACTYFLMYDKTGIQEVVPQSLQDQFQEMLH